MKVVHIIGGGDIGGAKTHILYLLKELSKHMEVKLVSLRPGVFADEAKAAGIDVTVVKSRNLFADMKKVADIIRDGGFDIVHSHGAKANIFSLAARRKASPPTVTTVHSDYRLRPGKLCRPALHAQLYRRIQQFPRHADKKEFQSP